MKARIDFDIVKWLFEGIQIKRLLNVYRKILGTRSYGEDALASSCILAI